MRKYDLLNFRTLVSPQLLLFSNASWMPRTLMEVARFFISFANNRILIVGCCKIWARFVIEAIIMQLALI